MIIIYFINNKFEKYIKLKNNKYCKNIIKQKYYKILNIEKINQ